MASTENPNTEHRASPPQASELTRTLQRARTDHAAYHQVRGQVERRGMLRGSLLLALVVLLLSIGRAGLDRVFIHGWWRHW